MSRPARPALSFGIGAAVGTAGGLIGLGGAEFRLPALVGALRFSAREAVAINLVASFIVLAAAFPFRASAVPITDILPHLPAVLGMLAGSMSAAWVGAGWLRETSDRLLGRLILILLVVLGLVLIAEGFCHVDGGTRDAWLPSAFRWRQSRATRRTLGTGVREGCGGRSDGVGR